MSGRTNPQFMNGVPELLILRLLNEREMYGYELVRAIQTGSDEVIKLGEGVVYPGLHALERDGFLRSRRSTAAGRQRVHYRLTARGRRRLGEVSENWRRINEAVQRVLAGDADALTG